MKAGRHENVQMRINISSTRAKGTTTAATVAKFHVKNFINANVRKCTAQKHLNSRIELLCNQNFTSLQIASNRVKVSFHYFTPLYIGVSKNMQKTRQHSTSLPPFDVQLTRLKGRLFPFASASN